MYFLCWRSLMNSFIFSIVSTCTNNHLSEYFIKFFNLIFLWHIFILNLLKRKNGKLKKISVINPREKLSMDFPCSLMYPFTLDIFFFMFEFTLNFIKLWHEKTQMINSGIGPVRSRTLFSIWDTSFNRSGCKI